MAVLDLINKIKKTNNPIVVGLDPYFDKLPVFLQEQAVKQFGKTLEAAAWAIFEFNKVIIDHIYDIVPAVKPQSAYYELYGAAGVLAFQNTIEYAKNKGLYVIADVKRNDIGDTCTAYAGAYMAEIKIMGETQKRVLPDSITVTPYLGSDGLTPFIEAAKATGRSMFVLVKTSNKSSGQLQDLKTDDGQMVYEKVAKLVGDLAKQCVNSVGYSEIGVVVGATYAQQATQIRQLLPQCYFLVPGYGAQGAGANDVLPCFNKDGLGAIVNSSRGIIYAFNDENQQMFGQCARNAALHMKSQINTALSGVTN